MTTLYIDKVHVNWYYLTNGVFNIYTLNIHAQRTLRAPEIVSNNSLLSNHFMVALLIADLAGNLYRVDNGDFWG